MLTIGEEYFINSIKGYFKGNLVEFDNDYIKLENATMLYNQYRTANIFDYAYHDGEIEFDREQIFGIHQEKDFN